MTAYHAGDIPADALVVEPARNGERLDLTPFDAVEISLRDPAGLEVPTAGFPAVIDVDRVVIDWPEDTVLTDPGLYTLTVTMLSTVEGWRERVAVLRVVVEADDGWHSLESARDEWLQAPAHDLQLYGILTDARQQVLAYAPALADGAPIPSNYRNAQLLQARNIWNAGLVSPSGEIGADSFVIRPHPLDWMIRQILRPKTNRPTIG